MDWEEVRDQLRSWREDNTRHSEEVIDLWLEYLEPFKYRLGDEKWMILEQVLIAGLDANQIDIVDDCYAELSKQFPTSRRVMRLKAMRLEALERYDDALAIYDAIIHEDETNSMARKRRIAVLKGQGRNLEAIKELTEYLKKFMSDGEAWQELSDLYLKEGDYPKSCFCLEEVLLTSPLNHLLCTRYAEVKFTQGGQENVDIARSYFCQAIKLNPNFVRALYGLLLTCSQTGAKTVASRRKELQRLAQFAQRKIQQRYAKADISEERQEAVRESIAQLGIADKP